MRQSASVWYVMVKEGDMMESEKGREVKAHYLSVARQMRAYSSALHRSWYDSVDSQLLALLRRTLLVVPPPPPTSRRADDHAAVAPGTQLSIGQSPVHCLLNSTQLIFISDKNEQQ